MNKACLKIIADQLAAETMARAAIIRAQHKLFGVRYLATLFGLTLFTHQVGAFFGAWLGGIAITESGNYTWMWYADIALSGAAALINLPIREQHPRLLAASA